MYVRCHDGVEWFRTSVTAVVVAAVSPASLFSCEMGERIAASLRLIRGYRRAADDVRPMTTPFGSASKSPPRHLCRALINTHRQTEHEHVSSVNVGRKIWVFPSTRRRVTRSFGRYFFFYCYRIGVRWKPHTYSATSALTVPVRPCIWHRSSEESVPTRFL